MRTKLKYLTTLNLFKIQTNIHAQTYIQNKHKMNEKARIKLHSKINYKQNGTKHKIYNKLTYK